MSSPEKVASQLNKKQRQALRRISRGQTINWSAFSDPLVSRFYTMNVSRPDQDMNVVEWCDWVAEVRDARPRLTEFGEEVMEALERVTIESGEVGSPTRTREPLQDIAHFKEPLKEVVGIRKELFDD